MISVSLPSTNVQSKALAVAYSVSLVTTPSRFLLQASASARWKSGKETISSEKIFWKLSYAGLRSSRARVFVASTIRLLASSLHQPM